MIFVPELLHQAFPGFEMPGFLALTLKACVADWYKLPLQAFYYCLDQLVDTGSRFA